jgi:hypothetical protein
MTKVNFKSLDLISVKPLGVYGAASEIARFLLETKAIDAET